MCEDLTGRRFGRLLVLGRSNKVEKGRIFWECLCDCGKLKSVDGSNIRGGRTRSCGCLCSEISSELIKNLHGGYPTHGHCSSKYGNDRHGSTTYMTWVGAKGRCFNPNNEKYKQYGGRGITMCASWAESFEEFVKDMGEKPVGMTLERVDVNGNYEPSNCIWASPLAQARNKTTNIRIEYGGKTQLLIDWARELGIGYKALHYRVRMKHEAFDDAVQKLLEKKCPHQMAA